MGEITDRKTILPLLENLELVKYWNKVDAAGTSIPIEFSKESRIIAILNAISKFETVATDHLIRLLNDDDRLVRKWTARALGEIGDERAILPLTHNLKDWHSNRTAVKALIKLGWKPKSEKDSIYFYIAQRMGDKLRKKYDSIKRILLSDILSQEYKIIENALFTFIALGDNDFIGILLDQLDKKGTRTMAEAYLNCGYKT